MLNAKVISARLSAPLRSACSSVFDRSARPDAFRLRLRPDEELRQKPEFSGHPAETEADDPVVAFRDPQLGRAICLAELRKRGRWRRRRRPPWRRRNSFPAWKQTRSPSSRSSGRAGR